MTTLPLSETLDKIAESMLANARNPFGKSWILAMLGGAYIALAAFGSTMVSCNFMLSPETYGIGRCLAGLVFPVGLMLVVIAGGELFTGNCMMPEAWRRGWISPVEILRSWFLVYFGNFAGALIVAWMLYASGIFYAASGHLGAAIIKTASSKAGLEATQGFILGIFCNWLVCLAIWLAIRTREVAHKAILIFFPIWLFVASGYEHSVANMYYLSSGLLAAIDMTFPGITPPAFADCVKNLIFVTFGNIVGGAVFVTGAYALAYGKKW